MKRILLKNNKLIHYNVRKIVIKCSPYNVLNIEFSKIDNINIVDVYTNNNIKDLNLLFESEGIVLQHLPNNYFVRYF